VQCPACSNVCTTNRRYNNKDVYVCNSCTLEFHVHDPGRNSRNPGETRQLGLELGHWSNESDGLIAQKTGRAGVAPGHGQVVPLIRKETHHVSTP
jgi:hypothetical protein